MCTNNRYGAGKDQWIPPRIKSGVTGMNDNRFIIRRRHSGLEPESSKIKAPRSGQCQGVVSLRGECLADWITACAGMTKQRGISLIELIMFIVIVSVALAGILLVMNTVTRGSADPLIHKQALAIAESLLEEVELMPFTYCDPDDANAASAASAVGCAATVETLGAETIAAVTEDRYGTAAPAVNASFDNVNDYSGFSMAAGSIMDINKINIGLNGYSASVTMTQPNLAGIAGTDGNGKPQVLLINVTVTGPDYVPVTLEGYRTRFAPNSLP